MSDLISRSALSKWCHETMSAQTTTVGMAYIRDFWNKVIDAPAVDAVEVVRCKDCKYRGGLNGRPPFMFHLCTHAEGLTGAVRDNNFCSYGERKGDDD